MNDSIIDSSTGAAGGHGRRGLPVRAVAVTAGLVAAVVLAGCGSSSASKAGGAGTSVTSATPAQGQSTASGTPAPPSASQPSAAGTSVVTVTASASTQGKTGPATSARATRTVTATASGVTITVTDLDFVVWSSPSGRIACAFIRDESAASLRCDVQDAHWNVPASVTAQCAGTQVGSANLGTSGAAQLACPTDSFLGQIDVGANGTSWVTRPGAQRGAQNGRDVPVVPYGATIRLGRGLSCTSQATGMSCTNGVHSFTVTKEGYSFS